MHEKGERSLLKRESWFQKVRIRRALPIYEAIRYYESHQELLKLEAEEERYRLEKKGVSIEPTNAA